jgi:hypothetical protein
MLKHCGSWAFINGERSAAFTPLRLLIGRKTAKNHHITDIDER